jgi:DNA topoisomerase-2
MVLINGSSGIGTGWSSTVPNFNPRDLVENIRRLLNEEELKPMVPWYKGFEGEIEEGKSGNFKSECLSEQPLASGLV